MEAASEDTGGAGEDHPASSSNQVYPHNSTPAPVQLVLTWLCSPAMAACTPSLHRYCQIAGRPGSVLPSTASPALGCWQALS